MLKMALLIALTVALPQLNSCSSAKSIETSRRLEQSSNMQIDINEVQSFARIRLPKSYRDIKLHEESGIDRMMAFRFTMDEVDLEEFIASANYPGKLQSTELGRELYTDNLKQYSWWKPDDAKKFQSGSYLNGEWASKILIDLTNSPTIIVYMQVSTL